MESFPSFTRSTRKIRNFILSRDHAGRLVSQPLCIRLDVDWLARAATTAVLPDSRGAVR